MLRHTVLFDWIDGVTDSEVAAMASALDARVAPIETIVAYRHGPDLGLADGNAAYAIVADFASEADYAVYRDHPEHQAVIADFIKPLVAKRMAVQYDTD